MKTAVDFEQCFSALMEKKVPYEWQKRIYERFVANKLPSCVNVPTGCGKTAIMIVWLVALAQQAQQAKTRITLPRRLVWIVNRRTVVDQATEEAEKISKLISGAKDEPLSRMKKSLTKLSVTSGTPLAVSTLRGELADNGEWKLDPSRPSIVVGTVDMVGSKLLFSGYGDGRSYRPFHAGLLGVDTLVILDEAHLIPIFQNLLENIRSFHDDYECIRPFFTMYLTATHRRKIGETFDLRSNEKKNLKSRMETDKVLSLHPSSKKNLVKNISELACELPEDAKRVLVYVWSPKDALNIKKKLEKNGKQALLLTGQIRGYERDQLVSGERFKRFGPPQTYKPFATPIYLVATSAGEVGVNLDADYCVSDLVPIDSLIQRFGRVNRFGNSKAVVRLVYDEEKPKRDSAKRKTLEYLKNLPKKDDGYDICPNSLDEHAPIPKFKEAFSSEPSAPDLTPAILDRLSQTSIKRDLPLDLWLHGEKTEPETYFVWREDIKWLVSGKIDEEDIRRIFRVYPIRTREKLRVNTGDAVKYLKKIRKKLHVNTEDAVKYLKNLTRTILILGADRRVERVKMEKIKEDTLRYSTVLLPCEIGGLKDGMLDPKATEKVKDVADLGEQRTRYHEKSGLKSPLATAEQLEQRSESKKRKFLRIPIGKEIDKKLTEFLVYAYTRPKRDVPIGERQELDEHQSRVMQAASELAQKLGLKPKLQKTLKLAGENHDNGKKREWWQKAACNYEFSKPLAKSEKMKFDWQLLGGYRHEFGSTADLDEKNCTDKLALHLIAASHGYARPCFKKYGKEVLKRNCDKVNQRIITRFASLQRSYRWWNLAYLEALLKAADYLVSSKRMPSKRKVRHD